MRILTLFLPFCLLAECTTLLNQAEAISKHYALQVAKLSPPSRSPLTQKSLDAASVWFAIDLAEVATDKGQSAFAALAIEELWNRLREIGVLGVRLIGLKQGGSERTGLTIDPKWGSVAEWAQLSSLIQKKGIILVGDLLGNSIGITSDFSLALKNVGDYPNLYHLIEIEKADWKLLPVVSKGDYITNIPWLSLQELVKKGYVPEKFTTYVKESDWNATDRIEGEDQKMRRWIYLKSGRACPVIGWLEPTFAGLRIASADALDSFYKQGIAFFHLDSDLPPFAQENLPLFIRKLGAFSAQEIGGGIVNYKKTNADLIYDSITRAPLLHSLISGDAESLRLIYRLFLDAEIPMKRLVHVLQPFDQFNCDWVEFACNAKKKYCYYEEYMTGEALQKKLRIQDLALLAEAQPNSITPSTWVGYCEAAPGIEKSPDKIQAAHLLLAFFYAMQPGAFSFSVSDLLGALPTCPTTYRLMGINETTLYPSFPIQFLNPSSFAMGLKQILSVRKEFDLGSSELIEVPSTEHPGVLLLLHKMKGSSFLQLLAINFGRTPAAETLEMAQFREKTAINLMSGLAENKSFDSTQFTFTLPPLSGKVILFQPKYFD